FFKKHYKVITFDNRGVGKSDKPAGLYTTRMMADDTISLMNFLNIKKAYILGISMGGMIAQELTINYPERVDRLVLACTFSCKEGDSGDTPEQVHTLSLSPQRMASAMIDLAMNKKVNRIIFGFVLKLQNRFLNASDRRGLEGQVAACNNHNTIDRLPSIQAPTLVIVGTEDYIIKPSSSSVISGKIPHARLVKVKGGSHTFCLESKKVFNNEILNFLGSPDI
ncbi:MAG TPA: alpha/beta hydrolase, partial [Dehalococcoidia bacterium]|nr:alpha/beta hydrolase [Dehalococcoidia bacterium]